MNRHFVAALFALAGLLALPLTAACGAEPALSTPREPYGIGLAKDDTDFRNWINDILEKIYEDGRWAEAWEATAGTVLKTPEPPAVDRY